MEPIRVLLVDDQSNVRAGLKMRLALEPDIEVVGQAASGYEAVQAATQLPIDVVVLDYEMPDMNGPETLAALRREGANAPVVVLSIHDCSEARDKACKAGASAFVTKHQPSETLIAAIREAAASRERVRP